MDKILYVYGLQTTTDITSSENNKIPFYHSTGHKKADKKPVGFLSAFGCSLYGGYRNSICRSILFYEYCHNALLHHRALYTELSHLGKTSALYFITCLTTFFLKFLHNV